MSWWRRWPTHGGRGPKPLEGREGWRWLMLVVVCVVVVFVCCVRPFSYHSGRKLISAKAK